MLSPMVKQVASSPLHPGAAPPAPPAVRVSGLIKRYGGLTALDGVNLDIPLGRTLAVVGPNGAGKTTLIDTMVGLKHADSGIVEILGHKISQARRPDFSRIGAQLQDCALMRGASVEEYLKLTAALFNLDKKPAELAQGFGLETHLRSKVVALSVGLRQRLFLALALAHNPELVFLDEPTSGLDPVSRRRVWDIIKAIKARGRTIVLTSHYMDEVEHLADEVAVIVAGRIICRGTPTEVAAKSPRHPASLDDAYVYLTEAYSRD